jgi:hypothetical protein
MKLRLDACTLNRNINLFEPSQTDKITVLLIEQIFLLWYQKQIDYIGTKNYTVTENIPLQ